MGLFTLPPVRFLLDLVDDARAASSRHVGALRPPRAPIRRSAVRPSGHPVECFFASDLHLFANRSTGEGYLELIAEAAGRAPNFVLGGDIFDFRWARTATIDHAVDDAIDWLRTLLAECPHCYFHFLLGNHDYHQVFIERLAELASGAENLAWHRFYVRLGRSVFLHGDVADRQMDAAALAAARDRWTDDKQKGRLLNGLYDLAVAARLHKPIPFMVYPKRLVARRILKYLDHIGQGPASGVRDVYFGHTHRAMANYHCGGVTFHNGGAPIKGVGFQIVEAHTSG